MTLDDVKVHVRFKLSALWAGLMFCFIYNDYVELYQPGKLDQMLHGKMAIWPATQGVLFGTSLVVAIPAVMIVASFLLGPRMVRWLSLGFGVLYTAIDVLTMLDSWWYYIFFNSIETVLTLLIVWYAWTWPRQQKMP